MENTVYCSPTHLKLIVGAADSKTVRIEDFDDVPLPQEGMINGIITDEDVMTRFFAGICKAHGIAKNNTGLVVHTNNIQTKLMEVPPVSESRVLGFVRQEFGQYGGEDAETVYDFSVLRPRAESGGMLIMAAGAPAPMLRAYRVCLTAAGFNLKRIDIGVNCLIRVARILPQLRQDASVLVQIDGRNQALTMFSGGVYRVSNRYRLANNENTTEWAAEIGGNLSSMLQFAMAQRGQVPVSTACFTGVTDVQLAYFRQHFSYLGIEIQKLDLAGVVRTSGRAAANGFDPGSFLLNLGDLQGKK
jgi:Tfp pilus assembly PilM family ATPase